MQSKFFQLLLHCQFAVITNHVLDMDFQISSRYFTEALKDEYTLADMSYKILEICYIILTLFSLKCIKLS